MKFSTYESIIEAVLFVAGEPVSIGQLSAAVGQDERTTRSIVRNLAAKYLEDERGINIIELEQSFQMCTNPTYFEQLKRIFEVRQRRNLSPTLLETLAIVAYKQPVTKSQIEEIRGVNADHAVNKLLEYNLIEEKGRADTAGRPILFATTEEFLKFFGFSGKNQLPGLTEDLEDLRKEAEEEIK